VDAALDRLAVAAAEAARLVQLRYFAGPTLDEAAKVLGVSPRTADRLGPTPGPGCTRPLKAAGNRNLAVNYLATVKLAILQRYLRKRAPPDSSDGP
jgi:hypothetical protein